MLKITATWMEKKDCQMHKVATPCLDDRLLKKEELEPVGELSKVCSQIVLKCLHLAQLDGQDIL